MLHIRQTHISIVILYAIVLHLSWGAILLFDGADAVNATAVHALYRFLPSSGWLAAITVAVAVAASFGLFSRRWSVPLLMGQQIMLMFSASGAIEAIWLGHFADGLARAPAFIAADQIHTVWLAIAHTAAITLHAIRMSR